MRRRDNIWAGAIVLLAVGIASAQDSSTPPADATGQTEPQQGPVPAYGQENTPITSSENPPLSGIDLPSLEPNVAPLSYLQPGAMISETADSNAANTIGGGTNFSSITRALGSVALRRLWSHYDFALDYVGGAAFYSAQAQRTKFLHQLDFDQKITWKRGAFSVRDSFSYLPEGNFGASYGSQSGTGMSSLGNTSFGAFFGGTALGSFGLASRILNVTLADVEESLTPKSRVTAAGGYAFTHFFETASATGTPFLGVKQISAQAGYDRLVSAHTQVALMYGYQGFDYSVSGMGFHSQIVQGMYGYRISGRMDVLIAGGPQLTYINSQSAVCSDPTLPANVVCQLFGGTLIPITNHTTKLSGAGQLHLRYRFPRTSFDLSYQRYLTSGSGLLAGAQSDIARLSMSRPLTRVWTMVADIGYSRNSRLQQLSVQQLANCVYQGQQNPLGLPFCPGANANTYQYGFIGARLHRQFGHSFQGYVSYQFNRLAFDSSYCANAASCSNTSNRHAITLGLEWTPRPIRLD
jgi:hypothetical protein